jgi:hypothetical protein
MILMQKFERVFLGFLARKDPFAFVSEFSLSP